MSGSSADPTSGDPVTAAWSALGTVDDPCSVASGCPISLVDMGIVRSVDAIGDGVRVVLQLTEPSCIFAFHIAEDVEAALRDHLGESPFEVRLAHDYSEVWTEDMIAPAARARLAAVRASRPGLPVLNYRASQR